MIRALVSNEGSCRTRETGHRNENDNVRERERIKNSIGFIIIIIVNIIQSFICYLSDVDCLA